MKCAISNEETKEEGGGAQESCRDKGERGGRGEGEGREREKRLFTC